MLNFAFTQTISAGNMLSKVPFMPMELPDFIVLREGSSCTLDLKGPAVTFAGKVELKLATKKSNVGQVSSHYFQLDLHYTHSVGFCFAITVSKADFKQFLRDVWLCFQDQCPLDTEDGLLDQVIPETTRLVYASGQVLLLMNNWKKVKLFCELPLAAKVDQLNLQVYKHIAIRELQAKILILSRPETFAQLNAALLEVTRLLRAGDDCLQDVDSCFQSCLECFGYAKRILNSMEILGYVTKSLSYLAKLAGGLPVVGAEFKQVLKAGAKALRKLEQKALSKAHSLAKKIDKCERRFKKIHGPVEKAKTFVGKMNQELAGEGLVGKHLGFEADPDVVDILQPVAVILNGFASTLAQPLTDAVKLVHEKFARPLKNGLDAVRSALRAVANALDELTPHALREVVDEIRGIVRKIKEALPAGLQLVDPFTVLLDTPPFCYLMKQLRDKIADLLLAPIKPILNKLIPFAEQLDPVILNGVHDIVGNVRGLSAKPKSGSLKHSGSGVKLVRQLAPLAFGQPKNAETSQGTKDLLKYLKQEAGKPVMSVATRQKQLQMDNWSCPFKVASIRKGPEDRAIFSVVQPPVGFYTSSPPSKLMLSGCNVKFKVRTARGLQQYVGSSQLEEVGSINGCCCRLDPLPDLALNEFCLSVCSED